MPLAVLPAGAALVGVDLRLRVVTSPAPVAARVLLQGGQGFRGWEGRSWSMNVDDVHQMTRCCHRKAMHPLQRRITGGAGLCLTEFQGLEASTWVLITS
jgi:hypothetical protein